MAKIYYVLQIIIVALIVNGVVSLLNRNGKYEKGTVRLPYFLLIIGIIATTFFTVFSVFTTFQANTEAIVPMFFAVMSSTMIIGQINYVITFDVTGFTRKTFFGKKQRFEYSDITEISGSTKDVTLYIGKHRVRIAEMAIGKHEFLLYAKKEYRKHHNGEAIPKRNPHKDLFNNHVDNPGEFIFAYITIYVIIIGTPIVCIINKRPRNIQCSVCAICGVFFVLMTIAVITSIIIGRNPQKYSKKVIRMFFKDGYLH